MTEAGVAGIGCLTLSRRERMVIVEPRGPGMVLVTLRAADEVRAAQFGDNKGDVDAFSTTYTPATVQIDAFGRTVGVNAEFVQGVHKKGIVLSMPIDGVQALKGGQAAIAYGTFTSKFTDPNVPPGQGNWVQVLEREGDGWKIVASHTSIGEM